MDYRIIYKAGLKHDIQKETNSYYITNFEGHTRSFSHPIYNEATEEVSEIVTEEVPNMNGVPAILDDKNSIYSIIDEIHLTRGIDKDNNRVKPHITVVFKDKSKLAYYYEDPVVDIIQINDTDNTPPGTPTKNKLSHWFIHLEYPERFAQDWLINMLINYLDSFEMLEDEQRQYLFPFEQPVFFRKKISTLKSGFKYMTPPNWPHYEDGFLPPIYDLTLKCKTPPKSQFNRQVFMSKASKYTSSTAAEVLSMSARARGLNKKSRRKPRGKPSRGKPSRRKPSRGKPSRGKPSRGKPSRGKPSRRKH